MAGWRLEVARMAMYVMFPVALFHIFNQPAYFEEWVTKTKRELYPPEKDGHRKEMEDFIYEMREKKDKQMMAAFEKP